MIGPVALVKDKTEKSYSHLFKALVSEEPSLSQSLRGSGSDGEINLEKALDSSFQQAYRFRCANHLFNDVREKARQIGLPRATVESCIEELRNSCLTSTRESGATDLGNLVERWQKSADAGFKEPMTRFCSYVLRFVIPVIRDRVMARNAELAGFPQFSKVLYTQNVSESGSESCQPFVITRKQKRRVRKCPGCRKEFDESPPEMDIIVIHREKDWRAGTDKVTPVDNPRGYHLNLACIRARHPDFLRNPQNSKLVKDFDPNKEEEDLIVNTLDLDMIPPSE